jgi:Ca-activated chloride channel family protein
VFRFAHPLWLLLLSALPLLLWLERRRGRRRIVLSFSSLDPIRAAGAAAPAWKRHLPRILRAAALVLLVAALARPQSGSRRVERESEGVDIVLALDVSGSMKAEDFTPRNRLYVAKNVVRDFIARRQGDRVGLVVFSARAFTQCPLTLDYDVLVRLLDDVHIGMMEDGTAVGTALASAVNRLEESKAKSRVVILLTDGVNNAGSIDPITAAEIARAVGVKVYTIGVGKGGRVPYPVDRGLLGVQRRLVEVELDEQTLRQIASITGAQYFRAHRSDELEGIYRRIDELEKSKIETFEYVRYSEIFPRFAVPGLLLLGLELLLAQTLLRRMP